MEDKCKCGELIVGQNCIVCGADVLKQAKLDALEQLRDGWDKEPLRMSPYWDILNKRIEELKGGEDEINNS